MTAKLLILLSVSCFLGTHIAAQPAPGRDLTAAGPEDLGSIEGVVVNDATGEPVQKAVVSTFVSTAIAARGGAPAYTALGDRPSAVSDSSGRFTLNKLPAGRYVLTARRNGFIPRQSGAVNTVAVEKGQQVRDVVLRLTPAGVLTGRVLDQDGEPVVRAQIRAIQQRIISGRNQLTAAAVETTNDLGEYRLFDLPPGKYYVSATKSGANDPATGLPGLDYALTYYPGSTSIESALAVQVGAGQGIGGIDIRIALTRVVNVGGRLVGAQDFRNVVVMLTARGINSGLQVASSSTVNRGSDSFLLRGVRPGSYYLTARGIGGETLQTARMRLEVSNEDIDNVILAFGQAREATVRVRMDGTGNDTPQLTLNLAPRDQMLAGEPPRVTKNPDGSFKIQNAGPEAYIVQVNAAVPVYVKRIRAGGRESAGPVLDLSSGSFSEVEVVLGSNPPEVQGVVLDSGTGRPATNAIVVLTPREPENREIQYFYRQSVTDSQGRFVVRTPAPGKYTLYAWPDLESAYMEPEFLKLFEGKGADVDAGEGEKLNVQLPLLRVDAEER